MLGTPEAAPAPPQTPPSLWLKRQQQSCSPSHVPEHLQLLSLNAGGWEELQSPLDAFAAQHCPHVQVSSEQINGADLCRDRSLLPGNASPLAALLKREFPRPDAVPRPVFDVP